MYSFTDDRFVLANSVDSDQMPHLDLHRMPKYGFSTFLWIFYVFFCLVFAMSLCASVYMCFVVTCCERADLLALVCGF